MQVSFYPKNIISSRNMEAASLTETSVSTDKFTILVTPNVTNGQFRETDITIDLAEVQATDENYTELI